MSGNQKLDHIISLIKKDKINEAIGLLSKLLKDSELLSEVILQSARHYDLKRQIRLGKLENTELSIEKNKLRLALIEIVLEIKDNAQTNSGVEKEIDEFSISIDTIERINKNNRFSSANGNVNIKGEIVAGNNVKIKKIVHNTIISTKQIALFFIIIILMLVLFLFRHEISQYTKNYFSYFNCHDTSGLKILLLPFRPDMECNEIEVDYKKAVYDRLLSIKNKGVKISLITLEGKECPLDNTEAKKIGLDKCADLVIWGDYSENSFIKEISVSLKYTLVKDIIIDSSKESGNSSKILTYPSNALRNGALQENIDYIIYWIEGIASLKAKKYKKAYKDFNNILTDTTIYKNATTYHKIGEIYFQLGEYKKSLRNLISALNHENSIIRDSTIAASLFNDIGLLYSYLDKQDSAFFYLNKSLDLKLKLYSYNHSEIATTYTNLALIYDGQGEYKKALNLLKKSASIRDTLNSISYSNTLKKIGDCYMKIGELGLALEYSRNAILRLKTEDQNTKDIELASIYNQIGLIYYYQEKHLKALNYFQKSLYLYQKKLNDNHINIANANNSLGITYTKLNKCDTALIYFERAKPIFDSTYTAEHTSTLDLYDNISGAYLCLGEYLKSLQYDIEILTIRESVLDSLHPDIALSYNNIGVTHLKLEDFDKAIDYFIKALYIREKVYKKSHPHLASSYYNIAVAYSNNGEIKKAIKFHNLAIKIAKEKNYGFLPTLYKGLEETLAKL